MTPTIGRIVHYRLFAEEADKMNARREDARRNVEAMRADRPGFQAHVGNPVGPGEIVPLIITLVLPTDDGPLINGQAILDGNDALWVTNAKEGTEPGQWSWPPRV